MVKEKGIVSDNSGASVGLWDLVKKDLSTRNKDRD